MANANKIFALENDLFEDSELNNLLLDLYYHLGWTFSSIYHNFVSSDQSIVQIIILFFYTFGLIDDFVEKIDKTMLVVIVLNRILGNLIVRVVIVCI